MMGVNETFETKLNSENIVLSTSVGEIKCTGSEFEGTITNAGGAAATVAGNILTILLGNNCKIGANACPNPIVLARGTFEIHTAEMLNNGDGTLTSSGLEFTTECLELHCIWKTSGTDLGRILGGTPAHINAEERLIPRVGGRSGALCGNTLKLTARYEVTSPATMTVD